MARRPSLEVADVLRRAVETGRLDLEALPAPERRVVLDLVSCRTALRGGHRARCTACGHEEVSYNSCRNRHCPKCQAMARAAWIEDRRRDLIKVEYFHVVFTLPAALAQLLLHNKRLLLGHLQREAAATLLEIGRDEKHLGAELGFLAILHTWSRDLRFHPHVHCVVPGGGLSRDRRRWIGCWPGFLLPVRVLSRRSRTRFLACLRRTYARGELRLTGRLAHLRRREAWEALLAAAGRRDWVVHAKPPFGGPERVLKFLARYTHRVALSNDRLVALDDDGVVFTTKDPGRGGRQRRIRVPVGVFVRRFLNHVLPSGLVRIRYHGFLANRVRRQRLALCRDLLGQGPASGAPAPSEEDNDRGEPECTGKVCPACKQGILVRTALLAPLAGAGARGRPDDGVRGRRARAVHRPERSVANPPCGSAGAPRRRQADPGS